jgi:hypothetical protein
MRKRMKMRRNSPLRKIMSLIFLPLIIFIWMTGWIITQIAEPTEFSKISQKNNKVNLKSEEPEMKSELESEDSRIAHEPIIA